MRRFVKKALVGLLPLALAGQYLPLPYAPSIDATSRVNSSASFGSGGADIVNEFSRTSN